MKMVEIKNSITLIDNGEVGQDIVQFSGIIQLSEIFYEHINKYLIKNHEGQLIYAKCYKKDIIESINEGTQVLVEGFVTGICKYYSVEGNVILFYASKIARELSLENCAPGSSIFKRYQHG